MLQFLMASIICCDFEFMHVRTKNNTLVILTEELLNGKKHSPKEKVSVRKIGLAMTTGNATLGSEITVHRFVPNLLDDGLYTKEVCDKLQKELEEYRAEVINPESDIVVVWDKSGDNTFLDPKTEVVDLREIFQMLGILKFPQFCSRNEQSEQLGLKPVAKKLLSDFDFSKIDSNCQTQNWTNPTSDMMTYAKNDVVLLQELIAYAMRRCDCKSFMELLFDAQSHHVSIRKKNLKWFDLVRNKTFEKAGQLVKNNKDIPKEMRGSMLTEMQRKISENFKKFDKEQLYVAKNLVIVVYDFDHHTIIVHDNNEDDDFYDILHRQLVDIGEEDDDEFD